MYAPAPITGGTNAPPDAAAAVIPPAICGLNPTFRIIGMVNVPVVTALATALPESDPISPLPRTDTFAGPPGLPPKTRSEKSMMNCVAPDISRNAPNTTNRKTYLNITPAAGPNTPSVWMYVVLTMSAALWPECGNIQEGISGHSYSIDA